MDKLLTAVLVKNDEKFSGLVLRLIHCTLLKGTFSKVFLLSYIRALLKLNRTFL